MHLNEKYMVALTMKPADPDPEEPEGPRIFGHFLLIPDGARSPYLSLDGYTNIGYYSAHPATAEGFRKLRQDLLDRIKRWESDPTFRGSTVQ